jgi:hypothetical protein
MYVVGKKGDQWSIDEGLREKAKQIIEENSELFNHINLDQVIFLRMLGGHKLKWLGKCYFIGAIPLTIIPKYVTMKLREFGLLNLANVSAVDLDIFDIRFVIVINNDLVLMRGSAPEQLEEATLMHELLHIHPDGEKLVKHDLEDFVSLIDKFGTRWDEGIFAGSGLAEIEVDET